MIVKTKAFADRRAHIGSVGRAGENAVRALEVDCADVLAEYPNAQIIAVIQRPQGDPYSVELEADGAVRRLVFLEADYRYPGRLEIELRAIDGDKILKSAIYTATVDDSIRGEADAPGQPVRDVLDRLDAEIKQAQAVVDGIRQKLVNGEFNGKDAEVTAANIEAALGYAPVKPSELVEKQNVLTDSDKQSIVKTGMTSGAAWTAAEQAVARDRMGLDKPYELIEEIMTDGESIIERTQEPDGTKYSFSHVVVIVTAPKNIQGESPNIYVLVGMSGKVLSTYATFTEGIPYFKRTQYRAQIERGFASLIATEASISYGTSQYDGNTDGSYVLMSPTIMPAESHFDCIKVYNTLTTAAPAGFLVQIYGVRA